MLASEGAVGTSPAPWNSALEQPCSAIRPCTSVLCACKHHPVLPVSLCTYVVFSSNFFLVVYTEGLRAWCREVLPAGCGGGRCIRADVRKRCCNNVLHASRRGDDALRMAT